MSAIAHPGAGLSTSVLLLNKLYQALRVVSAQRALTLIYTEHAEVVSVDGGLWSTYNFSDWTEVSQAMARFEPERHDWVRTVHFQIAVPKIIRLLSFDRLPQQQVKLNRRNIFARDEVRCQYCGRRAPTSELSIDHVVPRSQGGLTTWTNVVCACVACNVRKGGRTPEQARMRLITKPVRPRRSPVLTIKLSEAKYASWRQFLDHAYWNVELK